jgi:hypothetical protein
MPNDDPKYDVFISYKSENKSWAETLARNLVQQRLTVWLDDWRKRPGDLITGTLKNAKAGLIVVTPEALASGWVQEEYESMQGREKLGSFQVILVVLGEIDGLPFLSNKPWIDFTDPEKYRRGLYEVVQGVRGARPDPEAETSGAIERPPPLPETATITDEAKVRLFDSVFDELDDVGMILLLAQEGMGAGGSDLLDKQARLRFGETNVFHIVSGVYGEGEVESYFLDIAGQLGLPKGAGSAVALANNLPMFLAEKNKKILLMLTNFENGPKDGRDKLAAVLRSFIDSQRREVRILIQGGESLAALKYEPGDLSGLNIASARLWPELTQADLYALFKHVGRVLDEGEALSILGATGGEPRLVGHCLRHRAKVAGDKAVDYEQVVRGYDIATPWFAPIRGREADAAKASRLLKDMDLGVFTSPWFSDPIKRSFFWKNALAVREIDGRKRLQWRCEALREVGQNVLECDE